MITRIKNGRSRMFFRWHLISEIAYFLVDIFIFTDKSALKKAVIQKSMVIEVNFLTEIVNKKWQETQTCEHTIFKITKST